MADSVDPVVHSDPLVDHHREVRVAYLGGFSFLAYEGLVWLVSAAFGSFVSAASAIVALVVGGTLSPLGALIIQKLLRRPTVGRENPLIGLSITSAFIIPLCYPVIGAATLANTNWFFPAFAVVVGAHFMPYAYIYRMRTYLVLSGALVAGATMIGYFLPGSFSAAGYFAGTVLLIFSGLVFAAVKGEAQVTR